MVANFFHELTLRSVCDVNNAQGCLELLFMDRMEILFEVLYVTGTITCGF